MNETTPQPSSNPKVVRIEPGRAPDREGLTAPGRANGRVKGANAPKPPRVLVGTREDSASHQNPGLEHGVTPDDGRERNRNAAQAFDLGAILQGMSEANVPRNSAARRLALKAFKLSLNYGPSCVKYAIGSAAQIALLLGRAYKIVVNIAFKILIAVVILSLVALAIIGSSRELQKETQLNAERFYKAFIKERLERAVSALKSHYSTVTKEAEDDSQIAQLVVKALSKEKAAPNPLSPNVIEKTSIAPTTEKPSVPETNSKEFLENKGPSIVNVGSLAAQPSSRVKPEAFITFDLPVDSLEMGMSNVRVTTQINGAPLTMASATIESTIGECEECDCKANEHGGTKCMKTQLTDDSGEVSFVFTRNRTEGGEMTLRTELPLHVLPRTPGKTLEITFAVYVNELPVSNVEVASCIMSSEPIALSPYGTLQRFSLPTPVLVFIGPRLLKTDRLGKGRLTLFHPEDVLLVSKGKERFDVLPKGKE